MKTAAVAVLAIAAWGWFKIGFEAFFWISLAGFVGLSILHRVASEL